MTFQASIALAVAMTAVFLFIWSRLPVNVRPPAGIYVASYLFTYCIGGVWIGLTNGDVLGTYFRDRMYVPPIANFEVHFWVVLLAPLIVPICVAALLVRKRRPHVPTHLTLMPSASEFIVVFAALSVYATYQLFQSGAGLVQSLTSLSLLYGDTTTIVEKRLALFDIGTTAVFGIIYSGLPALCHVAVFRIRDGVAWRVIVVGAAAITLALSFATLQVAPAAVFIGALFVSGAHVSLVRLTRAKAIGFGIAFLLLLQAMNGWKFAEWSFAENLQHLVFRMPSAYPYYLDCFPRTLPFLGTDWLGSITGFGVDPGGPFVVARYMHPDSLNAGAMSAPAHVQAYAEGGLLNALAAIVACGGLMAGVAVLYRNSRNGAVWHALYIQGLVTLYYATQTSFRGVVWHSYGIYWSMTGLVLVGLLSLNPVRNRTAARRPIANPQPIATTN